MLEFQVLLPKLPSISTPSLVPYVFPCFPCRLLESWQEAQRFPPGQCPCVPPALCHGVNTSNPKECTTVTANSHQTPLCHPKRVLGEGGLIPSGTQGLVPWSLPSPAEVQITAETKTKQSTSASPSAPARFILQDLGLEGKPRQSKIST